MDRSDDEEYEECSLRGSSDGKREWSTFLVGPQQSKASRPFSKLRHCNTLIE